jgi:(1->4)-alpha-D-glucan 1-alpha-D-glucosylmutase
LWHLCLTDPDNRAPVDHAARCAALRELRAAERNDQRALCRTLLDGWADGRIKMYTLYKALDLRREMATLFRRGGYLPLGAAVPGAPRVCAFARSHETEWALCVVPARIGRWVPFRHAPRIPGNIWGDAAIRLPENAPRRWRNVFTGATLTVDGQGSLSLRDVFLSFPAALLRPNPLTVAD